MYIATPATARTPAAALATDANPTMLLELATSGMEELRTNSEEDGLSPDLKENWASSEDKANGLEVDNASLRNALYLSIFSPRKELWMSPLSRAWSGIKFDKGENEVAES